MVMRVSDLLPQNGAWYSVTRAFGGVASRRGERAVTSRPANGGRPATHLVNTVQDLSARGTCSPRRLAGGVAAISPRPPTAAPPPGALRSTATNTSRLPVRPGVTPPSAPVPSRS